MRPEPADNQVKTPNVNPLGSTRALSLLGTAVVLALAIALGGCTGGTTIGPAQPKITFTSLVRETPRTGYAPDEVQRSVTGTESLILTIEFEDGDGDIGGAPSSDSNNKDFIVEDIRAGLPNAYPYIPNGGIVEVTAFENSARIPSLDSDTRSPSIQGTIRFRIGNLEALPIGICLLTPSPASFRQQTNFKVYIKDRAGNKSNEITTSPVFVRCE